ncbi:C69 family dipeptidase [Natronococcus wangiae]|uniref:C69 family dipeptidase n=1 Tax=Natronococcus wangiae TaxID=3068275 RepID=UPI00273E2A99|nr:C69 family dipeptidase [Natronococcus sp. AD5]
MDLTRLTRRSFGALAVAAGLLTGYTGRNDATDEETETDREVDSGATAGRGLESPPSKSTGFYVGSDLTDDGSTLLGGFGHEPSSHWIEIVPRQHHPEDATTTVGVTEEADIPGELIEIPQAEETNKYVASMYSEFAGFPPPLTNGGLNEHGVAARDIWSPSREELVEMAEEAAPQTGPQYSDLAKAAMERASTAREAVEVVGGLMDEYGYSTYGGNSHLFADEDEGWVFINYAHPDGDLWAAERLGADEVRVSYFGYILDFPVDHEDDPDYAASDRLVSFADEQGWWDGEGDTLNLLEVYGAGEFPAEEPVEEYTYPEFYQGARHPLERERELEKMAPVSLEDMLALVRDPRWSTDFAGYGQVAHLRPDAHEELQTLWTAVTSAITTPFVPIPIAAERVPPEFRQHRYMTSNAAANFLDQDWQLQEATRYATREFKRLLYFTCDRPDEFYRDVVGAIEGFERELLAERDAIERKARALLEAGDDRAACELITDNVTQRLLDSLHLGMHLTAEVETETRKRFGIREPEGRDEPGETTPATSQEMAEEAWGDMVNGYDDELHADYPREHGAYTDDSSPDRGKRIRASATDAAADGERRESPLSE